MAVTTVAEAVTVSYTQFDVFCAVIMGILLQATLADADRNNRHIFMVHVLIAVIAYCLCDALWMLCYNGIAIPRTQQWRYVTNILLYTCMGLCSYTIYCFLASTLNEHKFQKRFESFVAFLPFLALIALVLSTPFTHLLFRISADGNLTKGPLYFVAMMLMYGHVVYIGIKAIICAFLPGNEIRRPQLLVVATYTVPIIIGASVHYAFYSLPTFSIGFTLSMLVIYIFQMREQISIDALTGIHNRRQGERFFISHIQNINRSGVPSVEGLYLFMMDLNKFKGINDTYGHTEGDRALVATADVLKDACAHIRTRCILSRFGGDEFVIGAVFSEEEAAYLTDTISKLMEEKNKELHVPYTISLSIGYARYKKEYKTLRGFLAVADKIMYEKKQEAHQKIKHLQM